MPGDHTLPRLRAALLVLPLVFFAVLSAACSGDALPWDDGAVHGDGTWHGTTDTLEDGTVVVRNPEQGIWTEEQAWRIEEELRIGSATGEGPEVFGRISALAVDSLGRIWVADGQAGELRVFGRDGRHVRTVGGQGEGPGELDWPVDMEVVDGRRLVVLDFGNGRYTSYDTAGRHLADHRRGLPSGVAFPGKLAVARGGRLVDVTGGPETPEGGRLELLDESLELVEAHPFLGPRAGHFAPDRVWQVDSRGYLWFGREDRYRIVQRRLEGDTIRILERDAEPDPYSEEERELMAVRVRGRMGAVESASGDEGDGEVREVDAGDMPEHEPFFEALRVDGDGRLWVAPYSGRESSLVWGFDLFDPDGRFLGRIRSDVGLRLVMPEPVVQDGSVYAVAEDSLEVQYVVRGRIARPDVD